MDLGGPHDLAPMQRGRQQRVSPADLKDPIAMADVAAAAGVSLRSLQDAFTRARGMTLMQCIRARRLECLRAALAGARRSVSAIAHSAGLGHRGRAAAPLSGALRRGAERNLAAPRPLNVGQANIDRSQRRVRRL
jgi:transcriptional regulator GlxA family with amidase domain